MSNRFAFLILVLALVSGRLAVAQEGKHEAGFGSMSQAAAGGHPTGPQSFTIACGSSATYNNLTGEVRVTCEAAKGSNPAPRPDAFICSGGCRCQRWSGPSFVAQATFRPTTGATAREAFNRLLAQCRTACGTGTPWVYSDSAGFRGDAGVVNACRAN